MTVILNLTWAVVLLPLVGAAASFLAESPRRAAQICVGFTGLALATSVVVLLFRLTHAIPTYENTLTFWDLPSTSASAADSRFFSGDFPVLFGIRVDPLSAAFMASALFLTLVVQVHAVVSLRGDPAFRRFFWVASTLAFGMLALISSPNLFQFWLGWEVTGVAAWMLAAHHWQQPGRALAATRTFVVLRVADLALLLGLVMVFAKFALSVAKLPAPTGQTTADPLSFSVLSRQWHLGHIGAVTGVGARTLVVLAVLFVIAAVIRAAIVPFHVWFTGVLEAPVAGQALIAISGLVPAALLLARVYPLLLEAPQLLTVLALVGAVGSVAGAVLALAQRDLFRIGMFSVGSQAGLILAALGMGGYSPALFLAFTASCLSVLYFLVAANLRAGYRSHDLVDYGGAWHRMPRTALALGAWAVGISGLSLNTYSVLSATLRNVRPVGGSGAGTLTQVVVAVAVLITMALTAVYAFRVLFLVATGSPARRRGFDGTRVSEADPHVRRTVLVVMAGSVLAVLVGIPGVNSFMLGSRRIAGLTFSHFIFYGDTRQQLALDFLAVALAVVLGCGGALMAWWLFSAAHAGAVTAVRGRFDRVASALAGPTPSERVASAAPAAFVRAGEALDKVDRQLLDPIPNAMGESVVLLSIWLGRLRTARFGVATAAAFAMIAILLAATVLAVTGHLPITIQ